MSWKLFLDDDRPCPPGWVLARSVAEAQELVGKNGLPLAVSFDHDMKWYVPFSTRVSDWFRRTFLRKKRRRLVHRVQGWFVPGVVVEPTGLDFAFWLMEESLYGAKLPKGFTYRVHSANLQGSVMIRDYMFRYLRQEPAGWQNWWFCDDCGGQGLKYLTTCPTCAGDGIKRD